MGRTFALGCFARYQTLYSQQVRAINLADSLSRTGLLTAGQHVLIAGGGIAGMTAAVAARKHGARVTLVEQSEQLIPFQRASTGRYLHPYAYDWPFVDDRDAGLPFMSWEADSSNVVFDQLQKEFEKHVRELGQIEVNTGLELRAVTVRDDGLFMDVRPSGSNAGARSIEGDIMVVAIGFGRELRYPDMRGYWEGDGIASVEGRQLSWLVSGSGDGALTDLIRLLVQDFNHKELVGLLLKNRDLTDELASHIRNSHTMREAFGKVAKHHRDVLLQSLKLRGDTQVRFCAPKDSYLESQESCILNRFLVYVLEQHVAFQAGRIESLPNLQRNAEYPYEVAFEATEKGGPAPDPAGGKFHGVIPRHGVEAVELENERVPKVWSSSEGLLDIWQRCAAARARWRKESKFDDRTRVRIFHDDFARVAPAPEPLLPSERTDDLLRVLVVSSSSPVPPGVRTLDGLVRDAIKSFEKNLKQELGLGRGELRREFGRISCHPDALTSRWLEHAIKQLCRADVVFFDITEYQPLVMMLLGMRAAARRGVNILCTYEERNATFWSRLPFNIKEMQPLHIRPKQQDQQKRVGNLLLDALARQRALPGYLDLPGFDQLRRGGLKDRLRTPIHWSEKILWLCSFDEAYEEHANESTIRDKLGAVFGNQVDVLRLTEISSPELASQRLFDAIRRYRLCIVDWTQWSSNVFFEFGVRLAANPRAPICLVSDSPPPAWSQGDEATQARLKRQREQVAWLERVFAAIRYDVKQDFDLAEVNHRIERMDLAEDENTFIAPPTFGMVRYDFVYRTIAAETSVDQQGLYPPTELLKFATANLVGEGAKRTLGIATLYADRNHALNDASRRFAVDYQVAAWRYARGEALLNPGSAELQEEAFRLAARIRTLLNDWPDDDSRKIQLLKELDSGARQLGSET